MAMFGFTNDFREYERVVAFRDAAIADGWSHEPTYGCELEERASKLKRDGFSMQILTRSRGNEVLDPTKGMHHSIHGKWTYEAQVSIWGPDGMSINVVPVYDWEAIKAAVRNCPECGAKDVETQRVAFANRACANCAPVLKKKLEKPGWCD